VAPTLVVDFQRMNDRIRDCAWIVVDGLSGLRIQVRPYNFLCLFTLVPMIHSFKRTKSARPLIEDCDETARSQENCCPAPSGRRCGATVPRAGPRVDGGLPSPSVG